MATKNSGPGKTFKSHDDFPHNHEGGKSQSNQITCCHKNAVVMGSGYPNAGHGRKATVAVDKPDTSLKGPRGVPGTSGTP